MSTSAVLLKELFDSKSPARTRQFDLWMLLGIAVAATAAVAGIALTGVRLSYFLQPTGALIVLGGTLGITLITTPRNALFNSARRVMELFWAPTISREALIEEIMTYLRTARTTGLLSIEEMAGQASNTFLKEALLLTLDVRQRGELQGALENKLRLRERHGEVDAKALEVAGGFAPTLGVIGTVVGLIDVLRQFSNLPAVAYGIGTAFVSTIYGLALANLLLLPAAHRIRASVAESFEIQELITEGALCIFDKIHPSLARERLNAFLREENGQ